MLRPTEMESTRVSIYRSFVLPEDYEEKISCPVSMRSGNEIEEVAFLFGQIYEYKYIQDWVLQNGTCPLTRYPATLRDIKKSNTINSILHHNK